MKSMTKVLFAALVAVPAMAMAVEIIDYSPSDIFAPVGFDSNDNTQIVLAGTYPNTCYKVGEPSVTIDKANKRVFVQDKAFHHQGICLYMMVPYHKAVNLGVMEAGDYDIMLGDQSNPSAAVKTGQLAVAKATSTSADDYLYAPVEEASLVKDNADLQLTLKGTFTKSCYQIKNVKVSMVTSPNNMIIVQPIAEEDGSTCFETEKGFEKTVTIKNAPEGRTLLHIRSLNGQAINRVLNL